MTVSFVEFDREAGEIYRSGSCGESDLELQKNVVCQGTDVMPVDGLIDNTLFYIHEDEVCPRPKSPVTVSSTRVAVREDVIIEGIPTGATVKHPDGVWVADSALMSWSCVEPGVYFIEVDKFPHQLARFEIEVLDETSA